MAFHTHTERDTRGEREKERERERERERGERVQCNRQNSKFKDVMRPVVMLIKKLTDFD